MLCDETFSDMGVIIGSVTGSIDRGSTRRNERRRLAIHRVTFIILKEDYRFSSRLDDRAMIKKIQKSSCILPSYHPEEIDVFKVVFELYNWINDLLDTVPPMSNKEYCIFIVGVGLVHRGFSIQESILSVIGISRSLL